jgi:hypothetical protein
VPGNVVGININLVGIDVTITGSPLLCIDIDIGNVPGCLH